MYAGTSVNGSCGQRFLRYLGRIASPAPYMSDYVLKPVTVSDADIVEIAVLLRAVFPDAEHFTDEAVSWQYRDNPDGQVVGYNAWLDAVLAAHYVTIPLVARVQGVEERGLLSLNTATHPVHQGKGLFTRLANATYAHARERGFGFVVGVANASSTHGFIKKLGFQLVSPLRAMIGIGQLPYREVETSADYERVWSDAAVRWRLSHPAYDYKLKRSGDQRMLLSARTQFGARYVLGTYPGEDLDGSAPAENGSVPMKAWIGLDPAMHWNGSLYVNVPMRFRPSPLNLIFKDLTGKDRKLDADRVRFQAMDFDIL
jgi:GNAT superfamily N-acetyltransferase